MARLNSTRRPVSTDFSNAGGAPAEPSPRQSYEQRTGGNVPQVLLSPTTTTMTNPDNKGSHRSISPAEMRSSRGVSMDSARPEHGRRSISSSSTNTTRPTRRSVQRKSVLSDVSTDSYCADQLNTPVSMTSTNKGEMDKKVTDEELYSYILRLLATSYSCNRRQHHSTSSGGASMLLSPTPNLQRRTSPQARVSPSRPPNSDTYPLFSSIEKNTKPQKFPKDLIKVMMSRLKKIVLKQDKRYNDDSLLRRSLSAFYVHCLGPEFAKQIKGDRRLEDLLMIFMSCASRELNKSSGTPDPHRMKRQVDEQLIEFVRFLKDCLVSGKVSSINTAPTIEKLDQYASNLRAKQTLSPIPDISSTPRPSQDLTRNRSNNSDPQSDLNQIANGQGLANIMRLSANTVRQDVNKLVSLPLPKMMAIFLTDYLSAVENGIEGRAWTIRDFMSQRDYRTWQTHEIYYIKKMLTKLKSENPDIDYIPTRNFDSTVAHRQQLFKVDETNVDTNNPIHVIQFLHPWDVRAFYRHLLVLCLQRDLRLKRCKQDADMNNKSSQNPSEQITLFSKPNLDLIDECYVKWRITFHSHVALMINVLKQEFESGGLYLDELLEGIDLSKKMLKSMRPSSSSMLKDNGSDQRQQQMQESTPWLQSDVQLYKDTIDGTRVLLIGKIGEALKCVFDAKGGPKIGPFIEAMDRIDAFDTDGYAKDFDMSVYQLELESCLETVAQDKYNELLESIPQNENLDLIHVVELADKVVGASKKIVSKYKFPLLDCFYISDVTMQKQLSLFLTDVRVMLDQLVSLGKIQDAPFEDLCTVYQKLSETRNLLLQVIKKNNKDKYDKLETSLGWNLEETFTPYILEWIRSLVRTDSWVESAISADQFTIDETNNDNEAGVSSSVTDLFGSFNGVLSVVKGLKWQDEYTLAHIYQELMRCVQEGICLYANTVLIMFNQELADPENEHLEPLKRKIMLSRNRPEKWLAIAKSHVAAQNGNDGSKHHAFTRYKFRPESCVKLNDISYASVLLDQMEYTMDSERSANIILHREQSKGKKSKKPNGYIFSITILQGEGLRSNKTDGQCDSYVTLIDQDTRRQFAKTKTIYDEQDPQWYDTFEITTKSTKYLIATVWDENLNSVHDVCGRATFDLDPSKFDNFMAREMWLELEPAGRVLVRVSMESEDDDIRFYFGKSFRQLRRTEHDMIALIVDKLSAAIEYSLSLSNLKQLCRQAKSSVDSISSWLSGTRLGTTTNADGGRESKLKSASGAASAGSNSSANIGRLKAVEIEDALNPLFDYLNDSFMTLAMVLTPELKIRVMTKTWKYVLNCIESLLLPPLFMSPSKLRSVQAPLSQAEIGVLYTWLSCLRDFFHHDGNGPSMEVLMSKKYQEIMAIPVYYDLSVEALEEESEKMATSLANDLTKPGYVDRMKTNKHKRGSKNRYSQLMNRTKTVMGHRNLKTIKKQKEELRKAKRAAPINEDVVLRILRLRNDEKFVARRLRQREYMAQTIAAERMLQDASAGNIHPLPTTS